MKKQQVYQMSRNLQRKVSASNGHLADALESDAAIMLKPPTKAMERQMQLQRMADHSRQVGQLHNWQHRANKSVASSRTLPENQASSVVQRTKWRHDGNNWVIESTTNQDTDSFPHPKVSYPNAYLNDTYDQDTGKYKSKLIKEIDRLGSSKGKLGFYDPRSTTGYHYGSGKKQQGPHTFAHITKRLVMGTADNLGYDFGTVIGSRLFPRPRVMNKMMRDRLKTRGKNWAKDTRKQRTLYLKAYKRAYNTATSATKRAAKLRAIRMGMELNPATVNNIGSGMTSASQIAAKGENRKKSAVDVKYLLGRTSPLKSSKKLKTMDSSGSTNLEKEQSLNMVVEMGEFLKKGQLEPSPDDSESDSEIDL
jgi:hypothetical protein